MDSRSGSLNFVYGKATGTSISAWITATANPDGERLKHTACSDRRTSDAVSTKYSNIDETEHQKIKSGFYMHVMYNPADRSGRNTGDYPMVIHAYARRDHDARGKLRSRLNESPCWMDPEIAASHTRSFRLPGPASSSLVYYTIAIHRVHRPFDCFDIDNADYKDTFDNSHAWKSCKPFVTAAFRYSRQKSQNTVASSNSVLVQHEKVQHVHQSRKQPPATARVHRFSSASTEVPDSLCSPSPEKLGLTFDDPRAWQMDGTNPVDVDEDRTAKADMRQEEDFIWISDDEDEVMGQAEDGQSDEMEVLETGRSIKAREVIVVSDEEDLPCEETSKETKKSKLLKQLEAERDNIGKDLAAIQEKHTALTNATRHLAEYEAWTYKLKKLESCKKEEA